MSKKDITIVIAGLVVLAAIILISYFLPQQKRDNAVDVVTDKGEYVSGESLKVKITNNSEDKLCFSSCYPYYIEKKADQWSAYKYENCPEQDKVDSCISPDGTRAFELTLPSLDKGPHRLMIQACAGCQTNDLFTKEKELLSNQFIIK
jgi:hypothetical protein